jgi:hypothetical protein
MKGISGCPVNPSNCVITVTALAPGVWVADLPPTIFSYEHAAMSQVRPSSLDIKLGMIDSHLLFPFDLNDFGIMDDDLDRPVTNPFQCEQDRLLDRLI